MGGIASACGGGTTMAPTPAPSPTPSPTTVLTGQVTDRVTSAPMSGANVVASYPTLYGTTDSLGNYSLSDLPAWFAHVWATAVNYEDDVQKYRSAVQNFRLYPIQRITAGDSTVVTVAPDDPLCNNDISSPGWGVDYVCRIVRIVAPTNGVLRVEALPIAGGARPPLVVEIHSGNRLIAAVLENPTLIEVTAGIEVMAHVEMDPGSTTRQSFTLTTSML
jgi:hypothetical protein